MNRFLLAFTLGTSALALLIAPSTAHAATRKLTVSIADSRLVEPPSGQKSMIFPVTLSGVWPEDVNIYYSTQDGPGAGTVSVPLATAGDDYSTTSGVITIPAGSTKGQISVPILADNVVEKDETFAVSLDDLSYADDPDNPNSTVVLGRSLAKGTIVEAVKGVVLGGKVLSYVVSPVSTFDPNTGNFVDNFDKAPTLVPLSGVSVAVTGPNTSLLLTTDSQGYYSTLVRPNTYSLKVQSFVKADDNGIAQTYVLPARTVTITTSSTVNNFFFYGVAGTVGVPNLDVPSSKALDGAYVTIEARLSGASAKSAPVATAIAQYQDSTLKPSRGFRFFLPALPAGTYTLTVKDVAPNNYYNFYYTFPTTTVVLPSTTGGNRPVAHVEIKGTLKAGLTPQTTAPSGGSS